MTFIASYYILIYYIGLGGICPPCKIIAFWNYLIEDRRSNNANILVFDHPYPYQQCTYTLYSRCQAQRLQSAFWSKIEDRTSRKENLRSLTNHRGNRTSVPWLCSIFDLRSAKIVCVRLGHALTRFFGLWPIIEVIEQQSPDIVRSSIFDQKKMYALDLDMRWEDR